MADSSGNGRSPVSVLGMHRCGTSLTARVLNLLGVDLGPESDFLEPRFDNPGGYWEQRPIMDVNDSIFEALGGTWWRPPEMPTGWQARPEVEELKPRAREVIASQFADATNWGWKDPRTSLTLPFWREIVPNARFVVCLRRPTEVVGSLLGREPKTHTWESAMSLWLRYSAEALEHTNGEERLLVFYEDYFADPEDQLSRLADFVGLDVAEVSAPVRGEIERVIEADLRHHRTTAIELADADNVPVDARAFFLAARAAHLLSRMEGDGGADVVHRTEPGLAEAIERLLPRLWHAASERDGAVSELIEREVAAVSQARDGAVDAIRRERDDARRAERQGRLALDRALEELDALRGEIEDGGGSAQGGGANRDMELAKLRSDAERERRRRLSLERSLSWRVTRPLRAAKRSLARARR